MELPSYYAVSYVSGFTFRNQHALVVHANEIELTYLRSFDEWSANTRPVHCLKKPALSSL